MNTIPSFKAYDIRGKVPDDLNEGMAYDIARGYVAEIKPEGAIAVGRDIRDSSEAISSAVVKGFNDAGIDTVDIGLCGTEMVYYASSLDGMAGGAMITASHNPKGYNGIKLVRQAGKPISGDTGLMDIERRVRTGDIPPISDIPGTAVTRDIMEMYADKILSFVDIRKLKPLKIIVNPGNGCAGPALDALAKRLPFDFVWINFEPDGTFPNGIPNPLLIENRSQTADAVLSEHADIGVAWDGDFDRCFLFDETGAFIEGYYLVGYLSSQLLAASPGERIVHDPRLTWNTIEMVEEANGVAVESKSGHSFMKEKMRETNAIYGGEMSAHHYFRDFTYSDSGMIPWLLIAQAMSTTGMKLSELVAERIDRYPCSGEINRSVDNADTVMQRVKAQYIGSATLFSDIDGICFEFGRDWRFNLRKSNTEPLVRLNVETAGNKSLLQEKTEEILKTIDS